MVLLATNQLAKLKYYLFIFLIRFINEGIVQYLPSLINYG